MMMPSLPSEMFGCHAFFNRAIHHTPQQTSIPVFLQCPPSIGVERPITALLPVRHPQTEQIA